MSIATKYRIFRRLCHNDEVLIMFNRDGNGGGFANIDKHLGETAQFLMEQSDVVKDFIIDAACTYLKKYEVQKQEFAKRLYNKD